MKIVNRTPSSGISSPKFPQQTTFELLFMEIAKKNVEICMKTAEMCFQKHVSTLDVAMVTKGGRRRLKNKFLLCKLVHLNCQKVSSP